MNNPPGPCTQFFSLEIHPENHCNNMYWKGVSPNHPSGPINAVCVSEHIRSLALQVSRAFASGLGGAWALGLFLAKHVRPAPLKNHPIWVVPKLKNHTPFWVTDCEKHPFCYYFILFYLFFFFFCVCEKKYTLFHIFADLDHSWVIWVTQPAPKSTPRVSLRFSVRTCLHTQVPSAPLPLPPSPTGFGYGMLWIQISAVWHF